MSDLVTRFRDESLAAQKPMNEKGAIHRKLGDGSSIIEIKGHDDSTAEAGLLNPIGLSMQYRNGASMEPMDRHR